MIYCVGGDRDLNKCNQENMPVERYKKSSVSYDTNTNYSLKCFSLSHLKLIPHFISMLPSILAGATKAK